MNDLKEQTLDLIIEGNLRMAQNLVKSLNTIAAFRRGEYLECQPVRDLDWEKRCNTLLAAAKAAEAEECRAEKINEEAIAAWENLKFANPMENPCLDIEGVPKRNQHKVFHNILCEIVIQKFKGLKHLEIFKVLDEKWPLYFFPTADKAKENIVIKLVPTIINFAAKHHMPLPLAFERAKERRNMAEKADNSPQEEKWRAILPILSEEGKKIHIGKARSNINAVNCVICKLQGMSHSKTWRLIFPQKTTNKSSIDAYMALMRKRAEELAERFNLTMPSWHTDGGKNHREQETEKG